MKAGSKNGCGTIFFGNLMAVREVVGGMRVALGIANYAAWCRHAELAEWAYPRRASVRGACNFGSIDDCVRPTGRRGKLAEVLAFQGLESLATFVRPSGRQRGGLLLTVRAHRRCARRSSTAGARGCGRP